MATAKGAARDSQSLNALLESLTFRWRSDGLSGEALKLVFGPKPPMRVVKAAALLRKAYHDKGYDLYVILVPKQNTPSAMQKDRTNLVRLLESENHRLATHQRAVSLLPQVAPEVLTAAIDCFESYEAAGRFLTCPSVCLGNRLPVELALTSEGKTQVLQHLGRLEHGVVM